MPKYGIQAPTSGLPKWLVYLRLAQFVIAFLIVILTGVAAGQFLDGTDPSWLLTPFPGFGFNWFAFAWTVVYVPAAVFFLPHLAANARPMIIMLVLEGFCLLWWLIAFAMMARDAGRLDLLFEYNFASARYAAPYQNAVAMSKAAAGIGALEFILFIGSATVVVRRNLQKSPTQPTQLQEWPKA